MTQKIKDLFAGDIYRRIEEVIKVDQTDEQVIRDEIGEYIVTNTIRDHFREILDQYNETPNKPHEGIGIWVSGFFGSGKSSFAKMLGLALQNRTIQGESAAKLLAKRTGDSKIEVLLNQISEKIPTDAVVFDVSTDRGIKSGNQMLTEIMYRLFLKSLGYANDLDLAELEIALEQKGQLKDFELKYRELFEQDWDANKDLISFSLGEASAVMHALYPERYSAQDTWIQAVQDRADINPGRLAERCKELMTRRRPDRHLVFVVDEVGQFVSKDVQKMLDLQAIIQSMGRVARGKIWVIVTSQEKLTELVGGLDDKRVELARLMDRFTLQVHLEPSDISEVTSKRVLAKKATAEKLLRDLYTANSGRLATNTRLSADITLPELSADRFMDLYPLLPYHIDLIINVVSGLRMQGGASKHVGGANRTIIKLAQQLLIHEKVGLAEKPVGELARIDQIYDLVMGNLPSELRGKIDDIKQKVPHPLAQPVAKAICLLQFVKSIHRTAENIAAALHPGVSSDSMLTQVRDALQSLVDTHQVRLAENQYRIPSPTEDDWEVTRAGFKPSPGDVNRLHTDMVSGLWEPRPSHNLLDAKTFKAGLSLNGRTLLEEDIPFLITLADAAKDYDQQAQDARSRSQTERKSVFWVAGMDEKIDRETVELYRSREILARKERSAKTKDETSLVAEEKQRMRTHEGELRRLLKDAMLAGVIYFRGNDRSPDHTATSVSQTAGKVLAQVLPDVFDRFEEGAAQPSSKDLDALLTNDNLRGLPTLFNKLKLLRDEKGQPVFNADTGPLKEVIDRIENRTNYGETASGRYLADELAKEPFGWSFDVVRLFVVTLVRAGKLRATSKGAVIESALSVEARDAFTSNNNFKACAFQKRVSGTDITQWLEAEAAYRDVFGQQLPELQGSVIAETLRKAIGQAENKVADAHKLLLGQQLPGHEVLEDAINQMRAIRTAGEDDAILTFNANYKAIKEAIRRAAELSGVLAEPQLQDIARAKLVLSQQWPFLQDEPDLAETLRDKATALTDLLQRETFYRELPSIDQYAAALAQAYQQCFAAAVDARAAAYVVALAELKANEAWGELNADQKNQIAQPLQSRSTTVVGAQTAIPFLRSETEACSQHLKTAIHQMLTLIDGNRLVTIRIDEFFGGRVETVEQMEAALLVLRQRIEKLLAEDKKVLIQ